MAACALEPSISWRASRKSKLIEALISSVMAPGPLENRPPHILLVIVSRSSKNQCPHDPKRFQKGARAAGLARCRVRGGGLGLFGAGYCPIRDQSAGRQGSCRNPGLSRRGGLGGAAKTAGAWRDLRIDPCATSEAASRTRFRHSRRDENESGEFWGAHGPAQPVGDMVPALPPRNARARSAARLVRFEGFRGGGGEYRYRAARPAEGFLARNRGQESQALYR